MNITCPYCHEEWDEDCDVTRIWLGSGEGTCPSCDQDFYLEAKDVQAIAIEEDER